MANRAVPVIIQLVVFYLVISWLVRLARRRRNAQPPPTGTEPRRTRPSAAPTVPHLTQTPPRQGRIERSQVRFNGMLWHVTRRPHRDLSPGGRPHGYDTYVDQPPRCPKCGLGVIEEKSWLGYTWSCPECGLKKRSGRSMYDVAESLARMLR